MTAALKTPCLPPTATVRLLAISLPLRSTTAGARQGLRSTPVTSRDVTCDSPRRLSPRPRRIQLVGLSAGPPPLHRRLHSLANGVARFAERVRRKVGVSLG